MLISFLQEISPWIFLRCCRKISTRVSPTIAPEKSSATLSGVSPGICSEVLPGISPRDFRTISPRWKTGVIPEMSTKVPPRIFTGVFHGFLQKFIAEFFPEVFFNIDTRVHHGIIFTVVFPDMYLKKNNVSFRLEILVGYFFKVLVGYLWMFNLIFQQPEYGSLTRRSCFRNSDRSS